jgi:O-antigen/teichoic acid export membrane protein
MGTGLVTTALYCAVIGLILLASHPHASLRLLGDEQPAILYTALLLVPVTLLATLSGAIARAVDRFGLASAYRVLHSLGRLLAISFVLLVLSGEVLGVLVTAVAVQAAAALWIWTMVIRDTGVNLPIRSDATDTLRFGMKSWTQAFLGRLHARVDVLLIAYFLSDPAQNAYYGIALSVIGVLVLVPEAISEAAYPQLAEAGASEGGTMAAFLLRNSLLWMIVFAGSVGILAPIFLPLVFGAPYIKSVESLLILLVYVVALTPFRILLRYFLANDRVGTAIRMQAIVTLLGIVLGLALIPEYGVIGAASARVTSQLIGAVLICFAFCRETARRPAEVLLVRPADIKPYRRQISALLDLSRRRRS